MNAYFLYACQVEYLQGLIADATAKGARVLNKGGGSVIDGSSGGSLMTPAVLYPVTADMRVYTEEQFGPVVPITVYDKESELTEYFRSTSYGQQAAVFTSSSQTVATLVDLLSTSVGRVNINTQCGRSPDQVITTYTPDLTST